MYVVFFQLQTHCIHSYNIGQVNAKLSTSHSVNVPFITGCKSNLLTSYTILIKMVVDTAGDT
jgi:hypothetical protein